MLLHTVYAAFALQVGKGSSFEFDMPLADSDCESESEADADLFSEPSRWVGLFFL
jgi:hypothetical protein